ncbi:MAG: protein kinase [Planctomycetota bacterium]
MHLLKIGETLWNLESKKKYKIIEVLGQGGFGRAYRASVVHNGHKLSKDVCLKATADQASWHHESYFGELLTKNKRVLQYFESFVLSPSNQNPLLYCVVLELAQHGDLLGYLKRTQKSWKPERVRRESIALLKMLDQLHQGNATHRDITPSNLFICDNFTLKLGDFGIACHNLSNSPRILNAVNSGFAPTQLLKQSHPIWKTEDDIYQVGQILAMLLCGNAEEKITLSLLDDIDCDNNLRAIIKKAIGPRARRYRNASKMLKDLQKHSRKAFLSLRLSFTRQIA